MCNFYMIDKIEPIIKESQLLRECDMKIFEGRGKIEDIKCVREIAEKMGWQLQ